MIITLAYLVPYLPDVFSCWHSVLARPLYKESVRKILLMVVPAHPLTASATSHEKQIVGLTDDNKAGTSRPRSDQKPLDSTKNVKLKDDGSWTVEEDNNGRTESVSVNADGTFQVKNKNSEDSTEEFTLNADGSWEKIEKKFFQRTKNSR